MWNTVIFLLITILIVITGILSWNLYNTSRKLKKVRQHILEQEKLQFLQAMLGSITHDLNSLIGVCISSTSYEIDQNNRVLNTFQKDTLKRSDLEQYLVNESESLSLTLMNLEQATDIMESFISEETRNLRLKPFLNRMVKSVSREKNRESVNILIQCPENLSYQGNPGTLLRVIYNVLRNSLLHGFDDHQRGQVTISVIKEEGLTHIRIADDGKGIPEKYQHKIFDAHFTTRGAEGGSGLGLFIVHTLLTQTLEGEIEFHSEPGKGTEFHLSVPDLPLKENQGEQ